MSIDQAKAFDSISHKYKNEVYKFFGFGPKFVNMLNTLCTNCKSCITFDDGTLSSNFDSERGDTQGNTPSPVLYNLAQQIFLFKLELCPEIKSVFVNHLIPRQIAAPILVNVNNAAGGGNVAEIFNNIMMAVSDDEDICFRNESKKENGKAKGFAYDTTGLTLFDYDSLSAIKKILIDFGTFSGLQCNVDKTVLMQIGVIRQPSQAILDLGFTLVDKIKILGMEIDQSLSNINENFVKIHESVKKTISYWERYNLTLPGRINVAKSLLVSLINYVGCFIMPEGNTLNSIQKSIDDYVIDKLRESRNRLYLPADAGGLGCFKLDEFLTAQQCVWVIRAARSCRDNWRVNLRILSYGNALGFSWRNVDQIENPILFGLGKAWQKLGVNHDSSNENYRYATVLFNPMIFQGPGNKNTCTPAILEADSDFLLCKKLSVLTVDECYGQFGFITRAEFRIQFGIDLTLTGYANLDRAVNHFVNRLTVNCINDGTASTLFSNIQLKKPGEKIRNMLLKRRKKPFDISTMPTCKTFFEITGIVRGVLGNKCAGQHNLKTVQNEGNYVEMKYMENPFLYLKASVSWPI